MSNKIYFTVGPSKLYPTVPGYMKEAMESDVPSISHRGAQFMEYYEKATQGVRALLAVPESYRMFFISSGTEGMGRIIQNCVEKKSGHVVYGSFSKRWMQTSRGLGKATEDVSVAPGEVPDISKVSFSPDVELIGITHNETSTGATIPFPEISELHEKYPNVLIGIDIVSSAPEVTIDWNAADCVFLSVQKGFGLPAGLGILLVSPRAYAKSEELALRTSIGTYHSFPELQKYADRKQTPETPNVLAIYLLSRVVEDMRKTGIDAIRAGAKARAEKLYAFLDEGPYKPFIANRKGRSTTTITATISGSSKPLIEALKAQGLIVGSGYGENKEKQIRIANFPAHTDEDFERLLTALREIPFH